MSYWRTFVGGLDRLQLLDDRDIREPASEEDWKLGGGAGAFVLSCGIEPELSSRAARVNPETGKVFVHQARCQNDRM